MQHSEPISELHKYSNGHEFIGDCRFCGICGALIHPNREDQHTNYHNTVHRILDSIAHEIFDGKITNIWLDLDNLRNGELT